MIFEDPTDNDATASLRCFVGWKTTEDGLPKGLSGRNLRTLDGEWDHTNSFMLSKLS